ncbi:MAG: GDSL-type esterase/lipase family protein, partial [Oscillospiraceae bacterium]
MSNKKSPKLTRRPGMGGGLSKNTIALIALSVALVAVIIVLIVLVNVWHSQPENQPPEVSSVPEVATAEPTEEPDEDPEPVITDVEFGSSDYSREFFSTDLFIGDSIATGFTDYSKLDAKNVAASVSLTPYKAHAEDILLPDESYGTALSYAQNMQPKRIFMMLGFNGLNSPIAMEGSFRALTEKLEEACPNAVIYCYSITPLTADSSAAASIGVSNANVLSFNEYLKTMCSELGVIYLDINTKMSDEDGCLKSDYNEYDGMHISAPTYDLILAYTQKFITETPEPVASSKHQPTAVEPAETTTAAPVTEPEPVESQPEQHGEFSSDYNKEFFADDLFIGDSITTGLSAYNILSPKNVAASVGYTPYKAYNTEIALGDGSTGTAYNYAVAMQPKRIFIML